MAADALNEPLAFRASIGGFLGSSFSVEWQDDQLLYEGWDHGVQTAWKRVRPTEARWRRFWDKCDELRVWDWLPEYRPEFFVTDGTSWELEIVSTRGKAHSGGSNAYPPSGEEEESKEFRAFCRAVGTLVGGTPFH